MTTTRTAALLTCSLAARHLSAAVEALRDALDVLEVALVDEIYQHGTNDKSQYDKDSRDLEKVSPATHADPLDPADEPFSHDETSHVGAAQVGTDPAPYVRTYDLDPVRPVQPVRPVPALLVREANVPDDRRDETFSLTEPTGPPRDRPFNARLFAEFWEAYPRRVGKKDAEKAFARICPTAAEVARMIAAIAVQRGSRDWHEGFIPHPATWLNGERWTDDYGAGPQVAAVGPQAAVRRAIGPRADGGTWRDRCSHTPECTTPTQCGARRLAAVVEIDA